MCHCVFVYRVWVKVNPRKGWGGIGGTGWGSGGGAGWMYVCAQGGVGEEGLVALVIDGYKIQSFFFIIDHQIQSLKINGFEILVKF